MSLRVRYNWATSLSCIGEGNGNPLQCSCLENPRKGGAWWAAIYGVTQSWTRLKWLSMLHRVAKETTPKMALNSVELILSLWVVKSTIKIVDCIKTFFSTWPSETQICEEPQKSSIRILTHTSLLSTMSLKSSSDIIT